MTRGTSTVRPPRENGFQDHLNNSWLRGQHWCSGWCPYSEIFAFPLSQYALLNPNRNCSRFFKSEAADCFTKCKVMFAEEKIYNNRRWQLHRKQDKFTTTEYVRARHRLGITRQFNKSNLSEWFPYCWSAYFTTSSQTVAKSYNYEKIVVYSIVMLLSNKLVISLCR